MELTHENFRAMIFYDFRRGLTQQECMDQLQSTFVDDAPSKATIYRWFNEFNRGRESLQDEYREGRPRSVVLKHNIDDVHNIIKEDRHVTYREIQSSLGISSTSVQTILHEHLGVKNMFPVDTT